MAKQNLTRVYAAANLSGAANNVIYLPIVDGSTLEKASVRTPAAQSGAAVFEVRKNGTVITGLSALTIANGAKIGSVSGLNIALVDGDEITLNLLSGNVSSPITFNLGVDDGQSSGGGGSSFSFYDPDKPPASPSSFDDEFTGTSLDSGWTTFGAADITLAVGDHLLALSQSCFNAQYKLGGVYRTVPAEDFDLVARMSFSQGTMLNASESEAGFILLPSNETAGFLTASLYNQGTLDQKFGQMELWSNRTTYLSTAITGTALETVPGFNFYRLNRTGTTITMSFSRDGVFWKTVTTYNYASTVTKVGLFIYNQGSDPAKSVNLIVDWIRKYSTLPKYLGGGR